MTNVEGVADWDGRGLPPVAAERMRRAAEGGAWTSLLSAPAAAGLEVAGFDPVGEVMGSMVQRIGWSSYYGCGSVGWGTNSQTITSGSHPRAGFAPYAHAQDNVCQTAEALVTTRAERAQHFGAKAIGQLGLRALPNDQIDLFIKAFVDDSFTVSLPGVGGGSRGSGDAPSKPAGLAK